MKNHSELIGEVADIYARLAQRLSENTQAAKCDACGKCCDFESFGHKLFVTTPEILYFKDSVENLNRHSDRSPRVLLSQDSSGGAVEESVKTDSSTLLNFTRNGKSGRCPYQVDSKCSVYPHRFAGCRIFCCKGDADFQSKLTEAVIKKFKSLCEKFQIPYRYIELPSALQILTTDYADFTDYL